MQDQIVLYVCIAIDYMTPSSHILKIRRSRNITATYESQVRSAGTVQDSNSEPTVVPTRQRQFFNTHSTNLNFSCMKNVMMSMLLFAMVLQAAAQSLTDKAQVLQKVLDYPAVQSLYPRNLEGELKQVTILQQKPIIFPINIEASKHGKPLSFMSEGQIIEHQIEAYFIFNQFDMTATTATVNFAFHYSEYDKITVQMELVKQGDSWIVAKSFDFKERETL